MKTFGIDGKNPLSLQKNPYFIFILVMSITFGGCLVIPMSEKSDPPISYRYLYRSTGDRQFVETRRNIPPQKYVFFGYTSKEEVLLRLGEPDKVWADEKKFLYLWRVVGSKVYIWVFDQAGMEHIPKTFLYFIEFDENNIIKRQELKILERHFLSIITLQDEVKEINAW